MVSARFASSSPSSATTDTDTGTGTGTGAGAGTSVGAAAGAGTSVTMLSAWRAVSPEWCEGGSSRDCCSGLGGSEVTDSFSVSTGSRPVRDKGGDGGSGAEAVRLARGYNRSESSVEGSTSTSTSTSTSISTDAQQMANDGGKNCWSCYFLPVTNCPLPKE